MKKFLAVILTLVFALGIAGCGYKLPADDENSKYPSDKTDRPELPPPDGPFTVKIKYDGKEEIDYTALSVQWQKADGSTVTDPVHCDSDGFASADGLDGEYTLALSGLDSRLYTYNPNVLEADNINKDVEIEIFKLINLAGGKGTNFYTDVMSFSQLGAYRLEFTQAGQIFYMQFAPERNGKYQIETIVDIAADQVNPRVDIYDGSAVWKPSEPKLMLNDGSKYCGKYTKNVLHRWRTTDEGVGNVFPFVFRCDSRVGYPVQVYFVISRYDTYFAGEDEHYDLVMPTENFYDESGELKYISPSGRFRYIGESDKYLDGSLVGYSDKDGYYHIADESGKITDKLLYVKLRGGRMGSYTSGDLRLRYDGKDYTFFICGYEGLRSTGYADAEKYKGIPAYADCLSSAGVYPVTAELKEFLMVYSRDRRYFYDGDGVAEYEGYNSTDADQWLLNCGYYA